MYVCEQLATVTIMFLLVCWKGHNQQDASSGSDHDPHRHHWITMQRQSHALNRQLAWLVSACQMAHRRSKDYNVTQFLASIDIESTEMSISDLSADGAYEAGHVQQ